MGGSGHLILAAAGDPIDLVQFGVLGVVLALFLVGWAWAKPAVDRLIADKERAEAQRDALIEAYQTSIIPALTEATAATGRAVSAIEEMKPIMVEVRTLLSRAA